MIFGIGGFTLPTYDERLAALEKDTATMKRDIIYKLDETNSAVTIIKGVVGNVSNDIRIVNMRLDGIDTRMARLGEQQNEQGQDIKAIKHRLEDFDQRFGSLETRLSEHTTLLAQILARLPEKP